LSSSLLLDTSIIIATIHEQLDELSAPMRSAITSPDATLYASVASLWEIAIKARLGKLALRPPLTDLPKLLSDLGQTVIPIHSSHVLAAQPMPATRDPFDRLLLAMCQVEGLRLVTLDRAISQHPLAWRS
jgi:PIN domain nuclease of toxin-antitoxin system